MANSSGIHWMSRERIGRAKRIGGLGFRDLHCLRLSLLSRDGDFAKIPIHLRAAF